MTPAANPIHSTQSKKNKSKCLVEEVTSTELIIGNIKFPTVDEKLFGCLQKLFEKIRKNFFKTLEFNYTCNHKTDNKHEGGDPC